MVHSSIGKGRWFLRWLKWTFRPRHACRTIGVWRRVDLRPVRIEADRARRAGNAVRSVVRRAAADGPIVAVSMVRDEVDIIEETIENLFEQGVDQVIVADNGSTDGTLDLLHQLSGRHRVHVVIDPIVEFWQGEKLSHLARLATRMGASWVIPFDADELWKGNGGATVAETLRSSTLDVVEASWWDFLPIAEHPAGPYAERFPYRALEPRPQVKVAFRAHWLARLWVGNHDVTVPRRTSVGTALRVAHYQFRTPAQMLRKATDGALAWRLAGEPASGVPLWVELAGRSEDAAEARRRRLVATDALVHDPASKW